MATLSILSMLSNRATPTCPQTVIKYERDNNRLRWAGLQPDAVPCNIGSKQRFAALHNKEQSTAAARCTHDRAFKFSGLNHVLGGHRRNRDLVKPDSLPSMTLRMIKLSRGLFCRPCCTRQTAASRGDTGLRYPTSAALLFSSPGVADCLHHQAGGHNTTEAYRPRSLAGG